MRVLAPIVSATVAPASAVPVMAAVCSLALTMSSPATMAMVGRLGAIVSTVMTAVRGGATLPAVSVAVTVRVSLPWPMAFTSSGVSW